MLTSAVLDHGAHDIGLVLLDVGGRRVEVSRPVAVAVRDEAARRAGSSSRAYDLSLLLQRALVQPGVLALHRSEAHLLAELALVLGIDELILELRSDGRADAVS